VIRDFEWAFSFWDLISEGSVQCELSQTNDLFKIKVTKDTVIIDILDPAAMDLVAPFFDTEITPSKPTMEHIKERRSVIFGVIGSLKEKKDELSGYMAMAQELADFLTEHKKTLILKEKGKQLAKIGYDADSLGMRLLNLKNIEVNDLSALMRLIDQVKPEN
jgi:hypothetical protein